MENHKNSSERNDFQKIIKVEKNANKWHSTTTLVAVNFPNQSMWKKFTTFRYPIICLWLRFPFFESLQSVSKFNNIQITIWCRCCCTFFFLIFFSFGYFYVHQKQKYIFCSCTTSALLMTQNLVRRMGNGHAILSGFISNVILYTDKFLFRISTCMLSICVFLFLLFLIIRQTV